MMRKKRWLSGLLIGTGATVLALLLWTAGILDSWEFTTWRWRVKAFARPGAATEQIKLILVDQESLAWGEKANGWSWPWPREVYAPIIDYCVRNGARAVVFDMLFTEPSLYGVGDDRALAEAISRAPVFVASLALGKRSGADEFWPEEVPLRLPVVFTATSGGITLEHVCDRATFPIPEVAGSRAVLGSVFQEPDFDGIFRRIHLFQVFGGRVVPSLGLAAYLATMTTEASGSGAGDRRPDSAANSGSCDIRQKGGVRGSTLRIAGRDIPVDTSGRSIPRFRGPAGTYESFSAAAVIQSELRLREEGEPVIRNAEVFRGATVFLGTSAPGLLDLRPTPAGRVFPGVEIHATALDNLISGDFLGDAPPWAVAVLTLVLTTLAGLVMTTRKKTRHVALSAAVALPVPVLIGFAAYPAGFAWPVMAEEAAVVLTVAGTVFFNYASEGRRRVFLKRAFQHYLSPAVIAKILEDPSRLNLGGERRELTIFFSDLQGFSSISERLDPHALTTLLNDYLSEMTDIILDEGGTLDKYEGDAIIAFWNAPTDQPDHALRACRAAMRCQERLAALRPEYLDRTGAELLMRIGINTGPVVVGNMGSRKRFDYTVLGDAANLASRLEGANKAFGTYTMVSESTWAALERPLPGREIGLLRVVGRKTPVRVFEPAVSGGSAEGSNREESERYEAALALFRRGAFGEALEAFLSLPDDPVSRVYAGRCREVLKAPGAFPEADIFNLTEK